MRDKPVRLIATAIRLPLRSDNQPLLVSRRLTRPNPEQAKMGDGLTCPSGMSVQLSQETMDIAARFDTFINPYRKAGNESGKRAAIAFIARWIVLIVGGWFCFWRAWELVFLLGFMPDLESPKADIGAEWEEIRIKGIIFNGAVIAAYFVALTVLAKIREGYSKKGTQNAADALEGFQQLFPATDDRRAVHSLLRQRLGDSWTVELYLGNIWHDLDSEFRS